MLHRLHDGVAAEHGEAAVGEVDEAHQAHGDGQPDRHDEQHHAGGHPAQQHAGDVDAEDHECRERPDRLGAARIAGVPQDAP